MAGTIRPAGIKEMEPQRLWRGGRELTSQEGEAIMNIIRNPRPVPPEMKEMVRRYRELTGVHGPTENGSQHAQA